MPIAFSCSSCGRPLRVRDDLAGRKILCPDCQSPLQVPDGVAPPPLPEEEDPYVEAMPAANSPPPVADSLQDRVEASPELSDSEDDRGAPPRKPARAPGEFGTIDAGIAGGLLMIVIGVIWEGIAIAFEGFSCYAVILILVGIVALIRGIVNLANH